MPHTITLPMIPAGHLAHDSFGGDATVFVTEFLTTEDGNDFVSRAEGVSTVFGPALHAHRVPPSQVDHFLAVVRPDREATVYCNELQFHCVAKRRVVRDVGARAGDPISANDIADLDQVVPVHADGTPVVIPPDCGLALIFSHRWRKGLYYDYSVLRHDSGPRATDLPRLFAHLFNRLIFQEMYALSEGQWRRLLAWGWFPFIGLSHEDRTRLLHFAGSDSEPQGLLAGVCQRFAQHLGDRLACWRRNDLLNAHMEFLVRAHERFEAGDYLSSVSLLLPRIEGVLRTLFMDENPGQPAGQGTMVSNLVENQYAHSLLLPNRFEEYLRRVYFRAFDQAAGDLGLSRNSHGHGVSRAEEYDFVRATVGFLTLDQIYYYLTD